MTQLEIATQIFCSKPDLSYEEAYHVAGLLIGLDKPKGSFTSNKPLGYDPTINPYSESYIGFDLPKRTADRTQQLIDFGFEADEDLIFVKGEISISPKLIEEYSDSEWSNFSITANQIETLLIVEPDKTPEELIQLMRNQPLQFVPNDFFKGNPYIEFEMDNSICRLYKLSESLDEKNFAEKDLTTKTGAKAVSKDIISSSENKEFELGITIFKK